MIPKKIHYCWFGRNPLPESALKCIASWRKYLPDYEIIEWNEDNFDVNAIPYTAQAYEAKKYAFVSDYARFKILYDHGGLYFDTDVEVIRPFDDILLKGAFMGCEIDSDGQGKMPIVAPGLGMAAAKDDDIYEEVLDYYSNHSFLNSDGSYNTSYAVVRITTDILKRHGLAAVKGIQTVKGICIYPSEYFNPLDDATGKLTTTTNTYSIHWFTKSWLNVNPWRQKISRFVHSLIGVNTIYKLRSLFR